MFDAFRNFVAEFVDGDRHPSQFADDDYRLAAAALLVHAAAIDGDMSQTERESFMASSSGALASTMGRPTS